MRISGTRRQRFCVVFLLKSRICIIVPAVLLYKFYFSSRGGGQESTGEGGNDSGTSAGRLK